MPSTGPCHSLSRPSLADSKFANLSDGIFDCNDRKLFYTFFRLSQALRKRVTSSSLFVPLLIFSLTSLFVGVSTRADDAAISAHSFNESALETELLPDIIVPAGYLADRDYSTGIVPGRRHLRFSNGTANVGAGKLHLYGVLPATSDSTQQINQRIFSTGGGFTDHPSGQFLFHQGHNHIHVDNWCQFRLRTILPGDGVGPIVAGGSKTSFCILDLIVYNSSLPGFPPGGEFNSCASTVQGLSVGWVDVYHKELAGQNIDITDVPPGEYWLESEVDPANIVQESDETNNIARIKVTISEPTVTTPDRYEPNDSRAEVLARVIGQINSPNLGPVNPQLVMDSLTLHTSTNQDFFRFYLNSTGTSSDFVKINFSHSNGDVDMALLDSTGLVLARSESVSDSELVFLTNRPKGFYFVQIYGFNGALASWYKLTINPPANAAPSISLLSPPVGNVTRLQAVETYPISWSASDPTNDQLWVTLYVDTIPVLDGDEQLLSTSTHLPAANTPYTINSAGLLPGRYWVYGALTDGGTTVGDWSDGTVTFVAAAEARYITGIVRGFDSLPLEGAQVLSSPEIRSATTTADGRFLLGPYSTSEMDVVVSHADYRTLQLTVPLTVGDTAVLDLSPAPIPASITLYVKSAHDAEVIVGAATMLSPTGFFLASNESGMVKFDSVPPGQVILQAGHPLYRSDSLALSLQPNQSITDTLLLRPVPASLAFSVRSADSVAVEGASILIQPGNSTLLTDSSGMAGVDSLDPGVHSYSISFSSEFHLFTDSVTLAPADQQTRSAVLLYRPAQLFVRAFGSDSLPLSGANISIIRDGLMSVTDDSGWIYFDSVNRGEILIGAHSLSYFSDTVSHFLQAGKTDTVLIFLTPRPGALLVAVFRDNIFYALPGSLRPVSSDVSELAGVMVQIDSDGVPIDSSLTDSSGIAHFTLPDGRYGVSSAPFGYLNSERIETDVQSADSTMISLTLTPICSYLPGDLNLDASVDLLDLTVLVDNLFISFDPLPVPAHANLDGSSDGGVDLLDLTVLVSSLFIGFETLPCWDFLAP